MMIESLRSNLSVLIVKPSSMGDIIHTFPVVRAIKMALPAVSITWVVADKYAELVRLSPHVDEIITIRRDDWARWWRLSTIRGLLEFVGMIRENEFGAIIDLQGLLRSGLVTFIARSRVKVGFGYAREGAALFYNIKTSALSDATHAIDRYMATLKALKITPEKPYGFGLNLQAAESLWADTVTPDDPYVVINPNSRWATKRWPTESFATLAKELYTKYDLRCVITGGREDMERCERVAELAGDGVTNLTGRGGLSHLAAILAKSAGMITNDSGPLHLAVALGVPTVSIFGPTDPAMTGPYGDGHVTVTHKVDCSPCLKRKCPYAHECMNDLPVARVEQAWRSLWRSGKP